MLQVYCRYMIATEGTCYLFIYTDFGHPNVSGGRLEQASEEGTDTEIDVKSITMGDLSHESWGIDNLFDDKNGLFHDTKMEAVVTCWSL